MKKADINKNTEIIFVLIIFLLTLVNSGMFVVGNSWSVTRNKRFV